jgi:hypothetical protein
VLVLGLHGDGGGSGVIQAMAIVLDFAPDHWHAGTRLVAIALADRVNHDWQCWPSVADLSRRTGLSERVVQRYLRYLEAEGVIHCHGQRYIDGQGLSNLWTWMWKLGAQRVDNVRQG